MDLYLFRLLLKAKEVPDLFEVRAPDNSPLSREDWLKFFFSREQEFWHYRSKFVFIPETKISVPDKPNLIFGYIARERRVHERTPPEEGLQPTEHLSWQAAFLALDPTDRGDDGQKVAIELNQEIGKPKALLNSIVRTLNQQDGAPYFTQAFPLVGHGSFWEFAVAHNNQIVSITFDVAAPNMFRGVDDFQEELRNLRDGENVANVKSTLESDTILKHGTPRMEGIVNYVESGGGELAAEAADGAKYSSTSHEVSETRDIEHHTRNERQFLREIAYWLDKVFP